MNVLIFVNLILIGIILFKLLYNPECFNIGIQNAPKKIYISKTLSLQDCNSNPIPSCSDDLVNHNGKCYRLLNKNDNLWFWSPTEKYPFKGKNILVEIKDNNNNNTEYTILRASGKLDDSVDIKYDILSVLLALETAGSIIYASIQNDENSRVVKFLNNNNGDIAIFGLTRINNKKKIFNEFNKIKVFNGGGILNLNNIVYGFYEDFVFNNMEYRYANFIKNEDGYKGYIINNDKKEEYSKEEFLINNPIPDVTIKFYIEDIDSVPTGIEPVT